MDRPAFERRRCRREPGLGAYSPAMRRLVTIALRVAEVDSTVLIVGESGVGKESLARFIHSSSPRAAGPFIPVNCGALPDGLFESELFGHARGAFTGALREHAGLFEAAQEGTLLLDEVGEVPFPMQVKLLRVLQEHQVRRVGENRERRVNVRIIAATNRDLAEEVAERRFRRDLFYRLRVVELRVPPLRERPEDLRGLAQSLLARVTVRLRRPITGYTVNAFDRMLRYPWPGNVRELENAVERACALATAELIDVDDLPDEVRHHHSLVMTSEHVRPLRDIERDYILATLERNHGSRTLTAEQLRIGLATLRRKLNSYGIRDRRVARSQRDVPKPC
jgi:two-component system response regulator HydG